MPARHDSPGSDRSAARGSVGDLFYGSTTVGERGQVVIPVEARRQMSITAGEKLLVVRHPFGHGVVLLKLDALHEAMEWLRKVVAEADVAPEEE